MNIIEISLKICGDNGNKSNKKMVKQDAGTSQGYVLVVMVFMLLFNVSSLPLVFYVVGIVGQFCPELSLHCLV